MNIKFFQSLYILILAILFISCQSGHRDTIDFNIVDYGAVGDCIANNTQAIQSAIDACAEAGGGRIVIPSGKFLSGTIVLKSHVELHVEQNATLLGSTSHEDYPLQPLPEYRSHKDQLGGFYALIYAEGAENISLTGRGTIDGQGRLQKPRPDSGISPSRTAWSNLPNRKKNPFLTHRGPGSRDCR